MMVLSNLWQALTRPHPAITDIEQQSQSRLLAMFTLVLSSTLALVTIWGTFDPSRSIDTRQHLIPIFVALTGLIIGLYFLNRAGKYRQSAFAFVGILFVFVHLPLLPNSTLGAGSLFFIALVLLISSIFLSLRTTIALAVTSLVIQAIFLIAEPRVITTPSSAGASFTLVAAGVILVFFQHRTEVERRRRADLEAANTALRESEISLEKRVTERTRDLQVAADVSKQVTTILDLHPLLFSLVERTRAGFNLYQVSIFLYDEAQSRLVYEAGTGEAGQKMLAAHKEFKLSDSIGLVPRSGRERQVVLVNDVAHEPNYFANPNLPKTRAELVLPMLLGTGLIGVLDLQAEELNRFSPDDLKVLTSLAEQFAVAVRNAQHYGEQVEVAENLRVVDALKSQFLASMSHELRTPLNAILNFTEFVSLEMLGPVNDRQRDALEKALDSGRHLLSLINDVLDMTKMEAGMMRLFIETDIDLHQELKPAIATTQTLIADKPVQLVLDIDQRLPLIVGDRRRIRQVLLNLLSNAAKFTEEGTITLSVKNQDSEVLFAVIDSGPGISLEDQEIIFEPFRQTETGIRMANSTGLGLPISKRLVEAHFGRLWLESQPGDGAAFYVTLPVEAPKLLQLKEATDVKVV